MENTQDPESSFPVNLPCEFKEITPHLGPCLTREERGVAQTHGQGQAEQGSPWGGLVSVRIPGHLPSRLPEPESLGTAPRERDPDMPPSFYHLWVQMRTLLLEQRLYSTLRTVPSGLGHEPYLPIVTDLMHCRCLSENSDIQDAGRCSRPSGEAGLVLRVIKEAVYRTLLLF